MEIVGLSEAANILDYESLNEFINLIEYVKSDNDISSCLDGSSIMLFDKKNQYETILSEWDIEYSPCEVLCVPTKKTTYKIIVDVSECDTDIAYYVAKAISDSYTNWNLVRKFGSLEDILDKEDNNIWLAEMGINAICEYASNKQTINMLNSIGATRSIKALADRDAKFMVSRIVDISNNTNENQLKHVIQGLAIIPEEDLNCCGYFRNMHKQLKRVYTSIYEDKKMNITELIKLGQRV